MESVWEKNNADDGALNKNQRPDSRFRKRNLNKYTMAFSSRQVFHFIKTKINTEINLTIISDFIHMVQMVQTAEAILTLKKWY